MAYCNKCAHELPDDSLFCNKCGTKVIEKSAPINSDKIQIDSIEILIKKKGLLIAKGIAIFLVVVIVITTGKLTDKTKDTGDASSALSSVPDPVPESIKANAAEREAELKQIIDDINVQKYTEARKIMNNSKYMMSDPTYGALWDYSLALQTEHDNDKTNFFKYLYEIDSDYNGVFSDNINKMKTKYQEQYNAFQQKEQELKKPEGTHIGATADEVLASSWGKPKKINRTTTANGTSEQWVYDGGYIYLDNGIVTAIQN